MEKGTTKWFSQEKGYGFITRDIGGDCFIHWREIKSDGFRFLEPGERVAFDVETSEKGQYATNLSVIFESE